jgi:hypothetical protein
MNQKTLISVVCGGLAIWIQINCYLSFHRVLTVPVILSALLSGCGLVVFERRNK